MFVRDEFVVEDAPHDAFAVDDEGDAAVESDDGPQDAVGFGDAFVRVTNHRKFDVERFREVALRAVFVRGHADNLAAQRDDFFVCVAKPRRLDRSPRGECFGEEVQHDEFAFQARQADLLARRRGSIKSRSRLSNADHGASVAASPLRA